MQHKLVRMNPVSVETVVNRLKNMTALSPELEETIVQAKLLVEELFPQQLEEFESIAVEPSKTTSNFVWPGGTKAEFELFTSRAMEEQNRRIDAMRLEVIQFLELEKA